MMDELSIFLLNEVKENPNLSAGALTAHVVYKMKPVPKIADLFWKVEKVLDNLVKQGKLERIGDTYKEYVNYVEDAG